jgi:hypothetical protein
MSATTSAVVSRTLLHPLDTLKTLAQTNQTKPISIRSLYSGLLPAVSFSVPALSIYLVSYDYVKLIVGGDCIYTHAVSATCAEVCFFRILIVRYYLGCYGHRVKS